MTDETSSVHRSDSNDDVIIYQKMLALEQELMEFQESSKELEQALELELKESEDKNALLLMQLQAKDAKIGTLNNTIIELTKEINKVLNSASEQKHKLESEIADLKKKLVSIEILNEDVLSHDRIIENKLALATQFNNELLEKIAMTENDLEMERQVNAQNRLKIFNLENERSEPSKKKAHRQLRQSKSRPKSTLSLADVSADGTMLDIEDFLASAPPGKVVSEGSQMPRSDSRTKIHELSVRSGEMQQRMGELSSTLALKANSTREVSPYKASTHVDSPRQEPSKSMTHSPSVRNLAKFGTNTIDLESLPLVGGSGSQDRSRNVRNGSVARLRASSRNEKPPVGAVSNAIPKGRLRSVVKRFFA